MLLKLGIRHSRGMAINYRDQQRNKKLYQKFIKVSIGILSIICMITISIFIMGR